MPIDASSALLESTQAITTTLIFASKKHYLQMGYKFLHHQQLFFFLVYFVVATTKTFY
jgi:hypothetical protein